MNNVEQSAIDYLFDPETLTDIASYLPGDMLAEDYAPHASGRMLEEQVELHLASGGTTQSTFAHVADAITNESFKILNKTGKKGGSSKDAYPSELYPGYNSSEIITELSDMYIMWHLNRLNAGISLQDIALEVERKLGKLDKARNEGKLIRTYKGTYYIDKSGD